MPCVVDLIKVCNRSDYKYTRDGYIDLFIIDCWKRDCFLFQPTTGIFCF